ncbi:glycerophosphodiester phosphodiesterase family protein [Dyadobacter sp. 3J3]|uniref:glycerophosphodiester phosphodiesterase n=1 Tax=Dyadobacter sp. 3J3 TaxID=2606600 RepID=UPI0013568489|nr:glycerophosphodiester phosphodiesterase family protein [Dyadobacter sp. 3J3]
MKYILSNFPKYLIPVLFLINLTGKAQNNSIQLIAHRGGVVDSSFTENGLPALKKAMEDKYAMIETDMRVTKDGVLIANHDADFERYYGLKEKVTEMNWAEIQKLSSKLDGNTPLKLESVLQFCAKNHMNVMLDNKIEGLDTSVFNKLLALLDQYHLLEKALMIGTDASTEFFTGKIKLSCTRKQLEENKARKDYKPDHYFLFERASKISLEDVNWAQKNTIMVVAAINKFHYKKSKEMYAQYKDDCNKMMSYGIKYFQIDSEFAVFLK